MFFNADQVQLGSAQAHPRVLLRKRPPEWLRGVGHDGFALFCSKVLRPRSFTSKSESQPTIRPISHVKHANWRAGSTHTQGGMLPKRERQMRSKT